MYVIIKGHDSINDAILTAQHFYWVGIRKTKIILVSRRFCQAVGRWEHWLFVRVKDINARASRLRHGEVENFTVQTEYILRE